jgi:hypothetical protein
MPKLICSSPRGASPLRRFEIVLDARLWAALEEERATRERERPGAEVSLAETIRACLAHGLSVARVRRSIARKRG